MHTLLSTYIRLVPRCLCRVATALAVVLAAPQLMAQIPQNFKNQSCYTSAHYDFQQLNDPQHRSDYYEWREQFNPSSNYLDDRFDTENYRYHADESSAASPYIQAAHTYVDTIYARKGSEVKLELGNVKGDINTGTYIRWYSYRTQRALRFNDGKATVDLLRPINDVWGSGTWTSSNAPYYCDPDVGYIQWKGKIAGSRFARMAFYYPTDAEFEAWGLANETSYLELNNRWYVVACDVSFYVKSGQYPNGTTGTLEEPVLTNRYVFYISGIDAEGADYEGADAAGYQRDPYWNYLRVTMDKNRAQEDPAHKHYYESRDIVFPYVRFEESASKEMVTLTKNATQYYVPGTKGHPNLPDSKNNPDGVDIYLDPGNSGIRLLNPGSYEASLKYKPTTTTLATDGGQEVTEVTIGGRRFYKLHLSEYEDRNAQNIRTQARCITFAYPHTEADGTQRVNAPGNTATIYVVSKLGDGLARYRLTFKDCYRLLSQSEIAAIDAGTPTEKVTQEMIEAYAQRTPHYLEKNYKLITELTFDYDPAAENIPSFTQKRRAAGKDMYPFPLAWKFSGYGFANGTETYQLPSKSVDHAQWGSYSIMRKYTQWDARSKDATLGPDSLPNGHKMSDPDRGYFLYIDAGTQPGIVAQIPFRDALCAGSQMYASAWIKNAHTDPYGVDAAVMMSVVVSIEDDKGRELESYVVARQSTGMVPRTSRSKRFGGTQRRGDSYNPKGKEEWLQTYFSFVLHEPTFHTELKDGYSKVYYLRLENNACSTNGADYYIDDIKLYVKKPQIAVTQVNPSCGTQSVRYQVKMDYDRAISRFGFEEVPAAQAEQVPISFVVVDSLKLADGYAKLPENYTEAQLTELINECSVKFALVDGSDAGHNEFSDTQRLSLYNSFERMLEEFPYDTNKIGYNPAGELKAGALNKWWRVEKDNTTLGGRYLVADILVGDGIAHLIPGRTYMLIADDGELMQSSSFNPNDLCAYKGSFVPRGAYYILTAGEAMTESTAYCAGQVNNFTAEVMAYDNGKPIALPEGRFDWFMGTMDEYRAENAEGLSAYEAVTKLREEYPDPEVLIDTIQPKGGLTAEMIALVDTLANKVRPGYNNPMLVLGRRSVNVLMFDNIKVVLDPIDLSISEDNQLKYLVCFEPVEVPFLVTGEAPRLSFGYNDESYPDDAQAGLRIGLTQVAAYSKATMTLPLRGVAYASKEGVDALGLIKAIPTDDGRMNGSTLDSLFLLSTDDPQYQININEGKDGQFLNAVGVLTALSATEGQGGQVTLRFRDDFKPREGFTYQLKVWYQEMKDGKPAHSEGDGTGATCYGSAILPLKIVPAYARWTGKSDINWNNDAYWKRSYRSELRADDNPAFDGYDYQEPAGSESLQHQGFVPMRFTRATFPEASQSYLYQAERSRGGQGRLLMLTEGDTQRPAGMRRPTRNIEYDLMAIDKAVNNLNVEPYYANTADEFHFEPRAEMLHTELATYKRAWAEVKWKAGQWQLAATPLAATLSGELYVPKANGWQLTQYFEPITFKTGTYDRFAPAIYQRGWSQAQAIRLDKADGATTDMAITGEWTGVYNKVDETFAAGTGFSVKPIVADGTSVTNDSVLVRLPKQDKAYSYYNYGSNDGSQTINVTADQGRLFPFGHTADDVTAPLQGKDGYYLVGNPFMSQLDLATFFTANPAFEASKYWTLASAHTAPHDLISQGKDDRPLIAPFEAFFVKLREGEAEPATVKFTAAMQTLSTPTATTALSEVPRALTLTATQGGQSSVALVQLRDEASPAFAEGEDVEVLLTSTEGERPQVYTVAGNRAATVNGTNSLSALPLGVWGEDGTEVDVTFTGLAAVAPVGHEVTLYDATTGKTQPLDEGLTVRLKANAHGRYYLQLQATDDETVTGRLSIYAAGNTLVVASPVEPINRVELYTPDGRHAKPERADCSPQVHTYTLPAGIYVVRAATQSQRMVSKVVVR